MSGSGQADHAAQLPPPSALVLAHDPSLVRALDLTATGCVAASLLVLAMSGEFPILLSAGTTVALVASLFWGRTDLVTRHRGFVNAALVVALGISFWLAVSSENYMYYAVIFLATIQVVKLYQRAEPTDMLQVLALALLGLVAGAVANPDLVFALSFFVTVVLVTWALILLHFFADACNQVSDGRLVGADPAVVLAGLKRHISSRFLLGTSLIAMVLFLCTAAIFLLFPRMGLGFLFKGVSGRPVSGFADRIELGHFGTIETDPSVVARVEIPGAAGQPPPYTPYLRGRSLDRYDKGRWIKTYVPRSGVRGVSRGGVDLPMSRFGPKPSSINKARVYLEPLRSDTAVLLAPEGTRALDLSPSRDPTGIGRPPSLVQDLDGDLIHSAPEGLRLVYDIYVDPQGGPGTPPPAAGAQRLTEVPEDLRPELSRIAREWTSGIDGAARRTAAIERRFRSDFGYTLEGHPPAPGEDPVMAFLTRDRVGHCEYFASAMVLLLRSVDIPARVVNGFAGGEWIRPGGFFLFRREDAHSWVEVHLDEAGWQRYDPTPRAFQMVRGGFFAPIRDRYDALRLSWMRWVVTFNADKQMTVFRGTRRGYYGIKNSLKKVGRAARWGVSLAVLALAAAGLFFALRRRRRGRKPRARRSSLRPWRRLEAAVTRRFRERHPSEPGPTWLRRAADAVEGGSPGVGEDLRQAADELAICLYAPSITVEQNRRFASTTKDLRRALSSLPRAERRDNLVTPPPPELVRAGYGT
jgi:protein-glutamine gamma-glutamyltransferase